MKEYTLSNGLTVWLNEDHTQPKVFGAVVVKAGAKDSPNTGIAHYFEHMMFKGTDKIGTTDYAAEKVMLDSIASKYDELAATQDHNARLTIQQEINEMSVRASEYVIPNEFDRLISRYGGTKLNAGTSYDFTVYFNTFSPQYLTQWAEINSERLLNPVFRLFQSELETVYEEKNMRGDEMDNQATEKVMERYFHPHPYAYPIIGSAENLKNPRLSEMQRFFDTYYVASNMGLILSGDFDTESLLPILQSSFSRVRKGEAPSSEKVELPPFVGKEKMTVKYPVPFYKVMFLGFRGLPANHPDKVALNIAVALLNNSNGTGYLDKLTVERKLLAAQVMNDSMNEAGILSITVMPKLFMQSYTAAEKLIWHAIEQVKKGDFSEATFQSLKLEQKREYDSGLEDISARAHAMIRIFSQGKTWVNYLDEVARINTLTKQDVMDAATRYFCSDYLYVTKTTGKYPKDYLPKPNYAPVIPKNRDASSEYVKQLEEIPEHPIAPKLVDFDHDVAIWPLSSLVSLYVTPNPANNIFSLYLIFGTGTMNNPLLLQASNYLHLLGTDELSFDDFRNRLQTLGSTLLFDVGDTDFTIKVSGFDEHLAETLSLVGQFMQHAKADNKKIAPLIDEAKVSQKLFMKSSDTIAKALQEKVIFGDGSRFLAKLPLSRIKKLKGEELVAAFQEACRVQCAIHYCGSNRAGLVVELLEKHLPLYNIVAPSTYPHCRENLAYAQPVVYFYNMPDANQSIVQAYVRCDSLPSRRERHLSKLFTRYFGGDMSSLLFQELREFRSYAYGVSTSFHLPSSLLPDKHTHLTATLSTQSDKTLDAMTVLNRLLQQMPERTESMLDSVKQSILNDVNNGYPSFRQVSPRIFLLRREGHTADPNREMLTNIATMTMDTLTQFHREQIAGRPVVYTLVGNSKYINLKELAARFGTVIKVNLKELYI